MIVLLAERRLGEMLAGMVTQYHGNQHDDGKSHDATSLSDLGITKSQSSRWQTAAAVPEDEFMAWAEGPDPGVPGGGPNGGTVTVTFLPPDFSPKKSPTPPTAGSCSGGRNST